MAFREEADPGPAGRRRSELHVRDNLKLLGLLVSSAVKSGCAQEAHVVRMAMKPHKLVDKPGWWWRSGTPVLDWHDHEESSPRDCDPSLCSQPASSLLE